MSKLSSLFASSRLRSKKENSPAVTKPTKMKSLSSSPSTAVSHGRKAIGKLRTVIRERLATDLGLKPDSLIGAALEIIQALPDDHKLSLLVKVARLLKDEKGRSILKLLQEQPSEEKPWQHEG